MTLWDSMRGTMEAELVSADPEYFLSSLVASGIPVLKTSRSGDLTVRITLLRRHWSSVRDLAKRKGVSLKLIRRRGLFWQGKAMLHRPVLISGLAILAALTLYLPQRILFVQVEGNQSVPARLILEQAASCGIHFGASRVNVRSEKMKNALLEAMPQLQWAGVNTRGCTAVITVRERETVEMTQTDADISSLVASRDGVITSFTVTKGNALCSVGQAVKAGQILISGYTDCGLLIKGERASGEIYADTQRTLQVVFPDHWSQKGEDRLTTRKYSLRIGKKLINFQKDSGIWDTFCDRIYEEKYVVAPGGFRLPVALIVETITAYPLEPSDYSQEDAQQILKEFASDYLRKQMVAGRITMSATLFDAADGAYRMDGQFACREMIGQVQKEEIITPNGNSN